jgi:hypothetical protein
MVISFWDFADDADLPAVRQVGLVCEFYEKHLPFLSKSKYVT